MATRKLRTVEPGITILEIAGRLNVGTHMTATEAQISQIIQMGSRKLILDFSKLDYIDSASIGMLTGVYKEMVEAGGQIRTVVALGPVAKVLKLIHMEKILPVDPDVATAQKALGG
jgi:anti-sigma B factor antagonist